MRRRIPNSFRVSIGILGAVVLMSMISDETYVYICDSSSTTSYHYNKDCHGLNRCTHDILKVTLAKAKDEYDLKLCGHED